MNTTNRGHHCHARGCGVPVRPELLMCLRHWRMVPRAIQRAVWATYRSGQCDDKNPSEAWHRAADAAIAYVATCEGRTVSEVERKLFSEFTPVLPVLQGKGR